MSDITIKWGYVDVTSTDGGIIKEPAMGIKPTKLGRTPIFAIPLSSAYKYADSEYLMKASFAIAEFLGMFPDAFLINRIADTILNYLPDLIKKRPYQHNIGDECGEGYIMADGEIIDYFGVTTGGGVLK